MCLQGMQIYALELSKGTEDVPAACTLPHKTYSNTRTLSLLDGKQQPEHGLTHNFYSKRNARACFTGMFGELLQIGQNEPEQMGIRT